jgi:hypothetical protein
MLSTLPQAAFKAIQQHPYAIAGSLAGSVVLANQLSKPAQRSLNFRGPTPNSYFWGVADEVFLAIDDTAMYEEWARTYGLIFDVPFILGDKSMVIMDPKALAAFLSRDAGAYRQGADFARFMRDAVS